MSTFLSKESSEIFAQCVASCNEPVMITDHDGTLVYVNSAWQSTYGYNLYEAIGKSPRLLRSEHQSQEFYDKMWSQIRDPKIGYWKGQLINKRKDGVEVPVLLTITPYKSNTNQVLGYMGIALDLTEQKTLQAQVKQQDRLATIGILTSGMAHEIGTPIGVIRGRAEMLLMDDTSDSFFRKNLEIIIQQTDRISGFINSLLKLSRSTSDLICEQINVPEVVDNVLDLLAPKIRKTSFEIESKFEKDFFATADIGRLEQILINLLINAVHAIEKKLENSPELSASSQYIRILGRHFEDHVDISVEDSGCGIEEENLSKIFEPFFTTKPTGQGTGLGLSIVSRILHEMNGTIVVESKIGKGSKFTFSLKIR